MRTQRLNPTLGKRERAVAARTRTKVRAARLIGAAAVSCSERDGRWIVALQLHNRTGSAIEAHVRASPRRRPVTPVTLAAGEARAIEFDAGRTAPTCAPRLADVRVAA